MIKQGNCYFIEKFDGSKDDVLFQILKELSNKKEDYNNENYTIHLLPYFEQRQKSFARLCDNRVKRQKQEDNSFFLFLHFYFTFCATRTLTVSVES